MQPPWSTAFRLTVSPLEIIVRGSIIYLVLFFFLIRFRRPAGALGVSDLLLLVLMADAAQNAMSAEYKSVFDGLILLGTLLFWNVFIDWMAVRWPWLNFRLHGEPEAVVRNGQMLETNMRRIWLTPAELLQHIREHGIEDVRGVKAAYLESDGKISVIGFSDQGAAHAEDDDRRGV